MPLRGMFRLLAFAYVDDGYGVHRAELHDLKAVLGETEFSILFHSILLTSIPMDNAYREKNPTIHNVSPRDTASRRRG